MILGLHKDTYSGYKQSVCEVRTRMFLHINGPNTIAQTDGQGDSNVTPNTPPSPPKKSLVVGNGKLHLHLNLINLAFAV